MLRLESKKKVVIQFLASVFIIFSVYGAYYAVPKQTAAMAPYDPTPIADMSTWKYIGIMLVMLIPGVFVFMRLREGFRESNEDF